jgi:hypothetical protein
MHRLLIFFTLVVVAIFFYWLGKQSAAGGSRSQEEVVAPNNNVLLRPIRTRSPKETAADSATVYELIDDEWLNFEGRKKDTSVGIHRTKNLERIVGIGVYNPNTTILFGEFHADTGHVKAISFKNSGKHIREWTFRENGSIESETIYEKDGRTGHKTYYGEDGTKDREEKFIRVHGS